MGLSDRVPRDWSLRSSTQVFLSCVTAAQLRMSSGSGRRRCRQPCARWLRRTRRGCRLCGRRWPACRGRLPHTPGPGSARWACARSALLTSDCLLGGGRLPDQPRVGAWCSRQPQLSARLCGRQPGAGRGQFASSVHCRVLHALSLLTTAPWGHLWTTIFSLAIPLQRWCC